MMQTRCWPRPPRAFSWDHLEGESREGSQQAKDFARQWEETAQPKAKIKKTRGEVKGPPITSTCAGWLGNQHRLFKIKLFARGLWRPSLLRVAVCQRSDQAFIFHLQWRNMHKANRLYILEGSLHALCLVRWVCLAKLWLERVEQDEVILGRQPTELYFHLVSTGAAWRGAPSLLSDQDSKVKGVLPFCFYPCRLLSTHCFPIPFFHRLQHSLWSKSQLVPPTGLEDLSVRLLTSPPALAKESKGKCVQFIIVTNAQFCFFPWVVQLNASFKFEFAIFSSLETRKPFTNVKLFWLSNLCCIPWQCKELNDTWNHMSAPTGRGCVYVSRGGLWII